jgi:hypothetical protein
VNNLLKLCPALIKEAGFIYVETNDILGDQQDGFHLLRSMHEALASLIIMMEDAKIYSKDIYIMYADFKCAFNGADHITLYKHVRELGKPS